MYVVLLSFVVEQNRALKVCPGGGVMSYATYGTTAGPSTLSYATAATKFRLLSVGVLCEVSTTVLLLWCGGRSRDGGGTIASSGCYVVLLLCTSLSTPSSLYSHRLMYQKGYTPWRQK